MITLGLDIGSNSVGSAWVDTDAKTIELGVSVFPAGVDEQETKRGAPKNQARREKRSQRRSIARRSLRKRRLRRLLVEEGLLPRAPEELQRLFEANRWPVPTDKKEYKELLKSAYTVWQLRRDALTRQLHPYELGRALVHLNQRRGAVGIETDPDDKEEGKVKEGIDRLEELMRERNAETVGQLLADLMDERKRSYCLLKTRKEYQYYDPIRNRQYRMDEQQQLYADRPCVREEFLKLWNRQTSFGGPLAALLTDELKKKLDEPAEDDTWRHKGELFGQRRTYWDTGTLGRCDLEPTERCVPAADMHAQEFRVIETVNNVRITKRSDSERALTWEERQEVIKALRKQKTGSVATVRKALKIDKKAVKDFFTLNIERDKDREINTDWFYREIVHGVFTEERWTPLDEPQKESVNRAILKFDPDNQQHEEKLRNGAGVWWELDAAAVERLISAWKTRPKLEKRLKLSRGAILNLLPYMNKFDELNNRWPTQIEARVRFAEDRTNTATYEQRVRYDLGGQGLTKRDRLFLDKHKEPMPPAPMLANPVVRKAIHEVRRHIIAWWRKFGRTPDRIVIEYVRSATQPEVVRNAALARNRKREDIRKKIIDQFQLASLSSTHQSRAAERVLLCRQQKGVCAYTGQCISEAAAADGRDVETDHIVPKSRSQDNGFNNKVLVKREANRGKGNRTVKEWMSAEQFADMEQRLAHLEKGESSDDYFTKKDYGRKWENLHRDAPTTEGFLASQFTDTAYAAKQVGQWLREVLYNGERDGQRRVFTTKGSYTSILRNDWGLSESDLDRQWHNIVEPGEGEGDNQSRRARKEKNKNRADHVHHAVDALCIAFAPDRVQDLARFAEEQEKARAELGYWPRRNALLPPWPKLPNNPTEDQLRVATAEFRQQVLVAANSPIVSHRPIKRKVVGALHKEDMWGDVDEEKGVFRIRSRVTELSPKMLRMPEPESDEEVKKRLFEELRLAGKSDKEARRRSRELVASSEFERRLVDPSLGKGGLVRDWELRRIVRACLEENGLDLDNFTTRQITELAQAGKIRMPSGVPIHSVITIAPISDPVRIPVRDPFTDKQAINQRTLKPLFRYHISRNNHHVEIREDVAGGEWFGECVTTFEAVRRVRPPKDENGIRQASQPAVDRDDREGQHFVMSLSEGDTIHARRTDRNPDDRDAVGYYVVAKLDASRIWFAPHWDARSADEQDRWDVSYSNLKTCGPDAGKPPYKVRVGPLGEVTILERD